MLAALIVAAVVAIAAIAALVAFSVRSVLTPGPRLAGRTVVINTRRPDDQTIRGVLHAQHSDRWTLREAVLVTGVGDKAAGGLVHVPVAAIAFVQEIDPPQSEGSD